MIFTLMNLTAGEQELFAFLKSASPHNLRVAGGWVRDRLLGRASDDVDIAVEGCSGAELAALVQAKL